MKKIITLVTRDKENGVANIIVCMFLVVIIMILLSYEYRMKVIDNTKGELDEGLSVSTLSALIWDIDEYSATGTLCVDTDKAFIAFKENLMINLDLNADMYAKNPVYYESIDIKKFTIYNVVENDIYKYTYNTKSGSYNCTKYSDAYGDIYAENGQVIECSSVYVQLELGIKGFMTDEIHTVTTDNLQGLKLN